MEKVVAPGQCKCQRGEWVQPRAAAIRRYYSRTLAIRMESHAAAKLTSNANALHSNATRAETAI